MRTQSIKSIEALAAAVEGFGGDMLFRGQNEHFGTDMTSGLRTSIDRRGCIPPVMLKWSHYAEFMLRQIAKDPSALDRLEFVQAILQHYGWRSFYLDLSASPAVSAYFAGHRWTSRRQIQMVEDCFEDPVLAVREMASYEPFEGDGHLYVISKAALSEARIAVHDLSQLSLWIGGQPRYAFQNAWLAGPLQGDLPSSCIIGHISAPAAVFREFASKGGFANAGDLFPDRQTDPILNLLLSLPWEMIRTSGKADRGGIEFFRRALDIPEYHDEELAKHQPTDTAFFCGATVSQIVKDPTLTVRSAPSHIIFGSSDRPPEFPRVSEFVRRHKRVLFEVSELIWLPETVTARTWGKGLWVEERPDGLIQVGDLIVEHPGRQLSGFGANAMWSYEVDKTGRWTRSPREGDCPCANSWRHEAHLSALSVLEHDFTRRDHVFVRPPPRA
ncbi:FRG domain-containing protein [Bosea sp. 685]|uniref:FRG domain-containing protein n=1 Tax=Bosea sp. 685 TaxID=3080057 RepID=UPI002892E0CF|nr:FRG domain-containing protein [Bosea sp. 685]WNJ90076.1 FRG domain-containing protein [Bosea sp. 685]